MTTYCYVYVLRSLKDKNFYVGFTKDVRKRFQLHNDGLVRSTKGRRPFELVYWEGCLNQADATRRERYLKSSWGKRYIKNRLQTYLTGQGRERPLDDVAGKRKGITYSSSSESEITPR